MQIPLSFVGAGKPVVASNRFRSRERSARVRGLVHYPGRQNCAIHPVP